MRQSMPDPPPARSARAEAVELLRSPRFLAVISITSMLPLSVAVVSPALPGMASGLGVSDARIGLVVTAITLPPMLLAPVVGVASDLFGRRTVALPGLCLFAVAGVAVTLTDSFPVILGLRGIQGVAMAGIGPLSVTLVGDLYQGSVRTTAQGIRSSTGGSVLLVVPLVAGALAGLAWQYPFYLYGAALVVAGVVYRFVPETAGDMATGSSLRGTLRSYARSIGSEFGDPSLVIVMLGGFVRFFSLFGFLTFVPIFAVRSLGASPFLAGVVVAMSGIRILLSPTAGWWVSRFSRRFTFLASLSIQVVVFALIPLSPTVWLLAALAVGYGAGDALLDPVVNDATTSMVAADNRNGIVGSLRVLKEAGKTAAPVALGSVLALGGYVPLFVSLAGILGAYAVAVVLLLDTGR
jgi:MFS family permease